MLGILLLQFVSADVIMPTVTKVYFEKDGKPYNGKIDFTVKGYGYSYPVGPPIERKPGTYTPKSVFEFSATYNNYGDKIYENYYMNYRQIDYFELEGKMTNGETFIIKNISLIPTSCGYTTPESEVIKDEDGRIVDRICEIRLDISNTNVIPAPEPTPIKKGFWQSIGCFFKGIFGKKC